MAASSSSWPLSSASASIRARSAPSAGSSRKALHSARNASSGLAELLLAELGELDVERLALDAGRAARRRAPRAPPPAAARRPAVAYAPSRTSAARAFDGVLLEQRLEPRHCLGVVRARLQHLLVERERAVAVEEPRLLELGEPVTERDERRRVPGLLGERGLAGEHLAEIDPALGLRAEPVEPGERVAVLRGRPRGAASTSTIAPCGSFEPLVLDGREVARGAARAPRDPPRPRGRAGSPARTPPGSGAAAQRVDEADHRLAVLRDEVEHSLPRLGGAGGVGLGEPRDAPLVLGAGGGLAGAVRVLDEERRVLVGRAPPRRRTRRRARASPWRRGPPRGRARRRGTPSRGSGAGRRRSRPPAGGAPRGAAGSVSFAARDSSASMTFWCSPSAGVDRLEHERRLDRRAAGAAGEVLEGGERRRVARHLREHLAVAGERALRVGEPLVADPPEPEAQLGRLGDEVRAAGRRRSPRATRTSASSSHRSAAPSSFPSSRSAFGSSGSTARIFR